MIADNLIYFAVFVFAMLVVGLTLTVIEFRYGEPKRQQQAAARKAASSDAPEIGEMVQPAR